MVVRFDRDGVIGRYLAECVAERAEAKGFSRVKARRLSGVAVRYFHGDDVCEGLSRSSRFKLIADLEKVGIDPRVVVDRGEGLRGWFVC